MQDGAPGCRMGAPGCRPGASGCRMGASGCRMGASSCRLGACGPRWTPKVTSGLLTAAGVACAWRTWWGASPSRPAAGVGSAVLAVPLPTTWLAGAGSIASWLRCALQRSASRRSQTRVGQRAVRPSAYLPKPPSFVRSAPQVEYHWDIIQQSETKVSHVVVVVVVVVEARRSHL